MTETERLDEFIQAITAQEEQLQAVLESVNYEQLNWRMSNKKWSLGQCISHLAETARVYVEPVRDAARAAEPDDGTNRDAATGPGFLWNAVLWLMRPPPKVKMPAPMPLRPMETHRRKDLKKEIERSYGDLAEVLAQCRERKIALVRIQSPLAKSLLFTVPRFCSFFITHGERHLWQLDSIRASRGFPEKRSS